MRSYSISLRRLMALHNQYDGNNGIYIKIHAPVDGVVLHDFIVQYGMVYGKITVRVHPRHQHGGAVELFVKNDSLNLLDADNLPELGTLMQVSRGLWEISVDGDDNAPSTWFNSKLHTKIPNV